jgi:hypothetical protein
MQGIGHLRRAKQILTGTDPTERERLRRAAHEFWSAVFESEGWPPELKDKAEAVAGTLLKNGLIDRTVANMDDAAVGEASRQIIEFCEAAENRSNCA